MKALTQSVLAAAMLLALPFAAAEACQFNQWDGNQGAATGDNLFARGPENVAAERISRYSGKCALSAGANRYVTDDLATAEGTYQARFYVLTPASGTATVFRASTGAGNSGSEVVAVDFTGNSFVARGATNATISGIAPGKWYAVTVLHQNGGELRLSATGNGGVVSTPATATSRALAVGSASLGHLGGTATRVITDEFESTKSTTAIANLLRGDATGDNRCDADDVNAVISEFFLLLNQPGRAAASSQPDCNEDGNINADDINCLIPRFFAQVGNGQPCGGTP